MTDGRTFQQFANETKVLRSTYVYSVNYGWLIHTPRRAAPVHVYVQRPLKVLFKEVV